MHFKIHRGKKDIGVSCVEVWIDSTRIVIGLGIPFVNPDGTLFDVRNDEKRSTDELIRDSILPDIPSLYQDGSNTKILIPHAHQDHYLFLSRINPSCHVWLGFSTLLLIELTSSFTGKELTIQNAHHIKHEKNCKIGDIRVTPYLMEESVIDNYSFLIESGGKTLFFSGDYGMRGEKNIFDWFCKYFNKDVDYLLLDGSAIERNDKSFRTESELKEEFIKIFNETKGITLVCASIYNIDRLITIYLACQKTKKIFLIDFNTANILTTLNKKTKTRNIPFPSNQAFREIGVYYPEYLTNQMIKSWKGEETAYPVKYMNVDDKRADLDLKIMLVSPSIQTELEQYLNENEYNDGCFIYSMDERYKNQMGATKDFIDFIKSKGMPIRDIHCSGHADLSGLKRMIEAVKPKNIIPIHNFEGDSYAELFEGTNVVTVNDKEEIII
jgi:ribonuclease J